MLATPPLAGEDRPRRIGWLYDGRARVNAVARRRVSAQTHSASRKRTFEY